MNSHAGVLLLSMLTVTVFLHTESIIESTENQTFGFKDVFYALWKVFTTLVQGKENHFITLIILAFDLQ
jgi:hypothetical protein